MSYETLFIEVVFKGPVPDCFNLIDCKPSKLVESVETTFAPRGEFMVTEQINEIVVSEGAKVRLIAGHVQMATPCTIRRGTCVRLLCSAQPHVRRVRVSLMGYQLAPGMNSGGSS